MKRVAKYFEMRVIREGMLPARTTTVCNWSSMLRSTHPKGDTFIIRSNPAPISFFFSSQLFQESTYKIPDDQCLWKLDMYQISCTCILLPILSNFGKNVWLGTSRSASDVFALIGRKDWNKRKKVERVTFQADEVPGKGARDLRLGLIGYLRRRSLKAIMSKSVWQPYKSGRKKKGAWKQGALVIQQCKSQKRAKGR
jgi:hypothetical protein